MNFVNIDAPYNLQYYKEGDYNSVVATMGCADGDELISYTYAGKFYCEGIKRLWQRIDSDILTKGLSNYKIPANLKVWDGENGFVEVKTVIKNPDMENWVRIKFNNGRTILVTEDHPLYTENRGRIHVNELKVGDTIKTYNNLPTQTSPDAITDTNLAYVLGLIITGGKQDIAVAFDGRTESDVAKKFIDYVKNERSIPSEIFTASREVRLSFLAGMIEGNEHINRNSKVQPDSTNKELALQQTALAQSLDLNSETNPTEIIAVTSIEYLGKLDKESYDLETVTDKFTLSFINSGNCRTRVMSNVNGPEQSGSRGNFSFVTINLPKLAIEAKGNVEEFFRLYDKYIKLSHDYLLFRLKTIEEKHAYNFPFLMGQGVWLDSDKLKPTDKIKDVLKHASYSIGFCGLAECLVALIGKHHGQSADAQELGLKIVAHLRQRTDEYTKLEKRNWTTFGTPAESTAGQFQRANRKAYGVIKGVTDRDYMTNSSHVPVYFKIGANDKIQIEAPYHALCNAGHIAYVEMDGDPTKNISAFEAVVRAMHDANMGYFSINHPVDRDPVCGYTGIIANECPHCHRKETIHGTFHIDKL